MESKKINVFVGGVCYVDIDARRIITDDCFLPGEYNPHNIDLWAAIGPYGVCGLAFGCCEQEALDTLADNDCLKALEVSEEEYNANRRRYHLEYTALGSNGIPCNLNGVSIFKVDLACKENSHLVPLFKVARDGCNTLDF